MNMNAKILCLIVFLYKIRNEGALAIVNGGEVGEIEKFYTVSIYSNYVQICTGSIIGKYWVVTATRCVDKEAEYFIVRELPAVTVDLVVKTFFKPLDRDKKKASICMIKVRKEFSDFRQDTHLSIPKQKEYFPRNCIVSLIGWAKVNDTTKLTKFAVQIPEKLTINSNGKFTISGVNSYFDTAADQGAPLVYDGKLIALAYKSYIYGEPDAFARISTHSEWLNECMDDKNQ